ncbi:MAG: hybrid sensor histidine kinase/response regulator [Alphaproteobacteria bacterium]|nr:MAG: hybrid sensor histidine kinase/response regulator [Alphaproteobacteria bacterium]
MTQKSSIKKHAHKTRKELETAIEQADAIAAQKSNFLATMSHEIRTPMQTIYGLLELIALEKPDENISSMVETAQEAASGLLEILDDVLDVAKMDADAMELDMFEVPVRLLVRGMLEALSVKVRGVRVQINDDISTDVPFVITGDPKRLRQILMNLCGNALKFTHEGTVTVHVSTKTQHIETPENGLGLRFEVIDTGIGMSAEVCSKLFQSFTQADNTTSRKYGGTGLGLSIAKKLVNLMKGEIGVISTEGTGSTFWFEIPTEEVSTDESTVDLPNLVGISVLSVEDHPQGAKEIESSLKSMGAKVESCATYKKGLELATHHPFDVAIIDQGLPDGLGVDLIRDILKVRPFTGMVMYTVRDDVGLSHSLNALGATYLTKPASRAGLGEAVKSSTRRDISIAEGPTRLLIAEDTQSIQDILKIQLYKLGVQADFVANGKEALHAFNSGKYGILITDLHMPEMDGFELVKIIRKQEAKTKQNVPIIALTADVQMAQREAFTTHGFDECLLKPVSLGQLRGLLIRWRLLNEGSAGIGKNTKSLKRDASNNSAINRICLVKNLGTINDETIDMMEMFLELTAPLITKIETALHDGDIDALYELGHSLKGGARSACCNALGDFASDLQDTAEKKDDCVQLVKNISKEFERVIDDVKRLAAE